jgi:peptide deformylase
LLVIVSGLDDTEQKKKLLDDLQKYIPEQMEVTKVPQVLKINEHPEILLKGGSPVDPSEIRTEEFQQLLERMYNICELAGGLGLAAPQIGVNKRVFIYRFASEFVVVINPQYLQRKELVTNHGEACLSVPGSFYDVKRHKQVTIEYLDGEGRKQRLKAPNKRIAFCIQHEIDHLDGVLIHMKGKRRS